MNLSLAAAAAAFLPRNVGAVAEKGEMKREARGSLVKRRITGVYCQYYVYSGVYIAKGESVDFIPRAWGLS